jgi:hypothetical protein
VQKPFAKAGSHSATKCKFLAFVEALLRSSLVLEGRSKVRASIFWDFQGLQGADLASVPNSSDISATAKTLVTPWLSSPPSSERLAPPDDMIVQFCNLGRHVGQVVAKYANRSSVDLTDPGICQSEAGGDL